MYEHDLKVGVQVLEYANRITAIMAKLSDASTAAHTAAENFAAGKDSYSGRARGEMQQFYDNYAANIDKLAYFESVSAQFLGRVFEEIVSVDEALAGEVVRLWLGGWS